MKFYITGEYLVFPKEYESNDQKEKSSSLNYYYSTFMPFISSTGEFMYFAGIYDWEEL